MGAFACSHLYGEIVISLYGYGRISGIDRLNGSHTCTDFSLRMFEFAHCHGDNQLIEQGQCARNNRLMANGERVESACEKCYPLCCFHRYKITIFCDGMQIYVALSAFFIKRWERRPLKGVADSPNP